jgi:tRNA(Ile)-lysidine synthase
MRQTGYILRPLLSLTRRDVLGYLGERGLGFRTDESNNDTRYLRNRIRHILVPLLDASFPHWQEPLIRLRETQGLTADFLAREASARLPWRKDGSSLSVDAVSFFAENEIIREEALFQALDSLQTEACRVCGGEQETPRVKRAALRPFLMGSVSALDLGRLRLENRGGRIAAAVSERAFYEKGFSVLIKRPGVYKLRSSGFLSRVKGELIVSAAGEGGFFAEIPLALKKEKTKYLALDRKGLAAVLHEDGSVFWRRAAETNTTGAYFAVEKSEQ